MRYINICKVIPVMLLIISCSKDNNLEDKISQIPIKFDLFRYEKDFYKSTEKHLPSLKAQYPYLFPKQYPDSIWISKIKDTLLQNLAGETVQVFGDFSVQKNQLKHFFQHMKYYFPKYKTPNVVTLISEVDYRNRVIYADSLLLISLDTYLGSKHKYYEGIYGYMRQSMSPSNLIVGVADSHIDKLLEASPSENNFLSAMITQGKRLYLKDALLPELDDKLKIDYNKNQWEWIRSNEKMVWQYFIEKELFYSTDQNLLNRFILPAPYSKFYLSLDNDSPPRVGEYMGWMIVKSFMENNDFSLNDLIKTNPQIIFSKSKYKPPQ